MPLRLNSSYDIYMENGILATNSYKGTISQAILTRLNMFLGEYQINESDGTPWFESVFRKPFNMAEAESVIKSRILQTVGVKELTVFKLNYTGGTERKLSINFQATTETGEVIEVEELGVPNV